MDMFCRKCHLDLDGGDIFRVIQQQQPDADPVQTIQFAYRMGWTTQNKRHFNKALIRKQADGKHLLICPGCSVIGPLSDDSIPITMEK